MNSLFETVKAAARCHWPEVLSSVAGIPLESLSRRGSPCPQCDGDDRFGPQKDFEETGGVNCRKCFSSRNGDGIAAVAWMLGIPQKDAASRIADFLNLKIPGTTGRPGAVTNQHNPEKHRQEESSAGQGHAPLTFPSREAAARHFRAEHGDIQIWVYEDASGEDVGAVVRWEVGDGKEIRPLSKTSEGWVVKAMPEPRPLFNLPAVLAGKDVVYVVEGEKCCKALCSLGVTATTWAGGSGAVKKSDWSVLNGRHVVVVPDNDDPGRQATDVIGRILLAVAASSVKVLDMRTLWADCPEKGDVFDWLTANDSKDIEDLAGWLEESASSAKAFRVQQPDDELEYLPFPVHVLPSALLRLVEAGAKSIQVDPALIALPLLTSAAALIGNSRRLRLKPGFDVPPILWSMVVGKSGGGKSPAVKDAALAPLWEIKREVDRQGALEKAKYREVHAAWKLEYDVWKTARRKGDKQITPAPEEPQPPPRTRLTCQNTTIEGLTPLLVDNPRGILLWRDELAGWFGGHDRYSKGSGRVGGDVAAYLSMFDGGEIEVDRKTDIGPTRIPSAAVCVTGGIQPAVLKRAIGDEHFENGLLPRFLIAYPPEKQRTWCDDGIDRQTVENAAEVMRRLYELDFEHDRFGEPAPALLKLSSNAREVWIQFYNSINAERMELGERLGSAWTKLENYAARLALVIHLSRWAAGDDVDPREVDADSLNAGILIARWCCHETTRVYQMLSETEQQRHAKEVVEFIQRKGGAVSPRDLISGIARIRDAEAAEATLNALVKDDRGMWIEKPPGPKGGRPTRKFHLFG